VAGAGAAPSREGPSHGGPMHEASMNAPLVIFLQHGGWEERYQAVTLGVTAAAFGEPVTLALFFEPLRLWVGGRFDEGAPPQAAAAHVAPLRESLDEARRELGLRVVACDTAIRLAGLVPDRIRPALDAIETLPALWRAAREGRGLTL
jgi:peroxiredoxin family protein